MCRGVEYRAGGGRVGRVDIACGVAARPQWELRKVAASRATARPIAVEARVSPITPQPTARPAIGRVCHQRRAGRGVISRSCRMGRLQPLASANPPASENAGGAWTVEVLIWAWADPEATMATQATNARSAPLSGNGDRPGMSSPSSTGRRRPVLGRTVQAPLSFSEPGGLFTPLFPPMTIRVGSDTETGVPRLLATA